MSTLNAPVPKFELPDGVSWPAARMSESEFLAWVGEHVFAEWVDGEVIVMAPVSGEHSSLLRWLLSVVSSFAEERGLGSVYGPEFMVRFGTLRRRRLPDLLFVSNARAEIIKPNHVEGAPDLIMEVVSPESESRDWRVKYIEYEQAGIGEYWIIDPLSHRIEAYAKNATAKFEQIPEQDNQIRSTILSGFYLRPSWLFADQRPTIVNALRELGVI
jgi:Uma2 family endonuclease